MIWLLLLALLPRCPAVEIILHPGATPLTEIDRHTIQSAVDGGCQRNTGHACLIRITKMRSGHLHAECGEPR